MRTHGAFTGKSARILQLTHEIQRAADSHSPVLINGEPGVGKALVAREIHARSARAQRAFVRVHCAGLSEMLLESELFGHVGGSFTGAYRDRHGKLALAHHGTIYIDDVGELTLASQAKLLRFIDTGEVQQVGADRVTSVADVRVIVATGRPLRTLVSRGLFRPDLFERLSETHLVVPPLRERVEDIAPLAEEFRQRFAAAHRSRVGAISAEAMSALCSYAWPGNVRELETLIERLVMIARDTRIRGEDLPLEVRRVLRGKNEAASAALSPQPQTTVDDLYRRLTMEGECFWTAVYPLYMQREITRTDVRDLVQKGLEEARGNYKIMVQLFNMESGDYKKFLNFLRKHQCQLPFKEYRQITHG